MEIKKKSIPDPAAGLRMADAYMRWQLLAAEEVVGKQGLGIVLRNAGLEKFIDNYPPENFDFTSGVTASEYAALSAGLLNFFGRAGKSMTLRIGRISSRLATEKQTAVFNVATQAATRLLPASVVIKTGLESMQAGFRKMGEDYGLRVEDHGHAYAYVAEKCPMCAGLQSDHHICWIFNGTLIEAVHWATGKDFEVEEVQCRAKGAPACVWEVSKTSKG